MATTVTKDVVASVAQVFVYPLLTRHNYFVRCSHQVTSNIISLIIAVLQVIKIADEGADLVRLTVQGRFDINCCKTPNIRPPLMTCYHSCRFEADACMKIREALWEKGWGIGSTCTLRCCQAFNSWPLCSMESVALVVASRAILCSFVLHSNTSYINDLLFMSQSTNKPHATWSIPSASTPSPHPLCLHHSSTVPHFQPFIAWKIRYDIPLVADIHFAPAVAMRVAEAFEKIRSDHRTLSILPTSHISSFSIISISPGIRSYYVTPWHANASVMRAFIMPAVLRPTFFY